MSSHNHFYDEYEINPTVTKLNTATCVIEQVIPMHTGERISGFIKISNPAEITTLHDQKAIQYDPEYQRGWRIKWNDGTEEGRNYLIKPDKKKAIAKGIAENTEYNRTRTVNARYGHVGLYFEPYAGGEVGRLYVFRRPDTEFSDFEGLLTIPDSAHRQEGDKLFVTEIVGKGAFSPDHAGFTPETYDLVLEITLLDSTGEGQAHYEYNELITKSSATRRSYLEAGQVQHENWVVHEVRKQDPVLQDLIEIYEKSISANSPKLVTFSTLAKGVQEAWGDLIGGTTKATVAKQLALALKMLREEIPEWGPLPFSQRKDERNTKLYSQAIVLRSMLRILRDLHDINVRESTIGDWNRWRSMIQKLKAEYCFEKGEVQYKGEFLSRKNPRFYSLEGQSIYQMNKGARERKEQMEARDEKFVVDPLTDLSVQNTRLSLDMMYGFLREFFGYHKSAEAAAIAAE